MSRKNEIKEELSAIAPILSKIETDGFKVPKNYFEQLADLVFSKIAINDMLKKESIKDEK